MIELSFTCSVDVGDEFVAPTGVATPFSAPLEIDVLGADMRLVGAPALSQTLIHGHATSPDVTIRLRFASSGPLYPEQMFCSHDSRYTRAATKLAGETVSIAEAAGGGRAGLLAIVQHVAGLFDYGHPEDRFYDDHNEMPQLCGLTQGSCVDINAYLIAALRSAGYEAGYLYGVFVPEEKRTWAEDGHCWVVTRCDGICEEWDIAHFKKMGRADIQAGLNPRPGVRLPLAHSMGWTIPALGLQDMKLMGAPFILEKNSAGKGLLRDPKALRIQLDGYEALIKQT